MSRIDIEWESPTTRLVQVYGLKRNTQFPYNTGRSSRYYEVQGRKVSKLFVHQTAGSSRDGLDAAEALANWITRSPRYGDRNGKRVRVGGGRGFPGAPYTFLVPHRPDTEDGKAVVYRLWSDEWVTWHTRRFNRTGVGVAFAGSFHTRHHASFSDRNPTPMAAAAGWDLIENYLMPRYGLEPDDIMGHFDAGKPTCPGDFLEAKIRRMRGEEVEWDRKHPKGDDRPLLTAAHKRQALVELGFDEFWDLGSREGMRAAVEAAQTIGGVVVDGIWGPQTEGAVRRQLASRAADAK
jgi:hypothetical protein